MSSKQPAAKKQKKETQIKDPKKAKETIFKYLEENLRPYSVNDVYLNLHGCIAKTLVTKALTSLADENKLVSKTFGKMSFYVFKIHESDLKSLENPEVSLEVVQGLEQEQNEHTNKITVLQTELKKVRQLKSSKDYMDLKQEISSEIADMSAEVGLLRQQSSDLSKDVTVDLKTLEAKVKKIQKECKTRKKDYESIVYLLRENMSNYKVILEEAGIEEVV